MGNVDNEWLSSKHVKARHWTATIAKQRDPRGGEAFLSYAVSDHTTLDSFSNPGILLVTADLVPNRDKNTTTYWYTWKKLRSCVWLETSAFLVKLECKVVTRVQITKRGRALAKFRPSWLSVIRFSCRLFKYTAPRLPVSHKFMKFVQ